MKDLKYEGDEPDWSSLDFIEKLKIGPQPADENDPTYLSGEINRLKL